MNLLSLMLPILEILVKSFSASTPGRVPLVLLGLLLLRLRLDLVVGDVGVVVVTVVVVVGCFEFGSGHFSARRHRSRSPPTSRLGLGIRTELVPEGSA